MVKRKEVFSNSLVTDIEITFNSFIHFSINKLNNYIYLQITINKAEYILLRLK